MPTGKKPSPLAPKKADQYKDMMRFKKRQDERLARTAGYGRADSTPKAPKLPE